MDRDSPRVYVVIVNWNGWRDTIECLASVYAGSYPNLRVVVCDNGSTDGSLEELAAWAERSSAVDGHVLLDARDARAPDRALDLRGASRAERSTETSPYGSS